MPDLTAQANELKQAPDQALQQELQHPTGAVPPYLTMAEAQRRQLTRQAAQAQQSQGQSGSVYDDIVRSMMARQPPQNLPAAPAGMVPMGNAVQGAPASSPQNFQAPPTRMMADGGLYDDEEDDDEFSAADPFLQAGSDPFLPSPQAQGIAAIGAPQDPGDLSPEEFQQALAGAASDDEQELSPEEFLQKLQAGKGGGGHGGRKGGHGGKRGRKGKGAAADDATGGGGGFKVSKILSALGKMGGAARAPHGIAATIHPPHFSYLHPARQSHVQGFHFAEGGALRFARGGGVWYEPDPNDPAYVIAHSVINGVPVRSRMTAQQALQARVGTSRGRPRGSTGGTRAGAWKLAGHHMPNPNDPNDTNRYTVYQNMDTGEYRVTKEDPHAVSGRAGFLRHGDPLTNEELKQKIKEGRTPIYNYGDLERRITQDDFDEIDKHKNYRQYMDPSGKFIAVEPYSQTIRTTEGPVWNPETNETTWGVQRQTVPSLGGPAAPGAAPAVPGAPPQAGAPTAAPIAPVAPAGPAAGGATPAITAPAVTPAEGASALPPELRPPGPPMLVPVGAASGQIQKMKAKAGITREVAVALYGDPDSPNSPGLIGLSKFADDPTIRKQVGDALQFTDNLMVHAAGNNQMDLSVGPLHISGGALGQYLVKRYHVDTNIAQAAQEQFNSLFANMSPIARRIFDQTILARDTFMGMRTIYGGIGTDSSVAAAIRQVPTMGVTAANSYQMYDGLRGPAGELHNNVPNVQGYVPHDITELMWNSPGIVENHLTGSSITRPQIKTMLRNWGQPDDEAHVNALAKKIIINYGYAVPDEDPNKLETTAEVPLRQPKPGMSEFYPDSREPHLADWLRTNAASSAKGVAKQIGEPGWTPEEDISAQPTTPVPGTTPTPTPTGTTPSAQQTPPAATPSGQKPSALEGLYQGADTPIEKAQRTLDFLSGLKSLVHSVDVKGAQFLNPPWNIGDWGALARKPKAAPPQAQAPAPQPAPAPVEPAPAPAPPPAATPAAAAPATPISDEEIAKRYEEIQRRRAAEQRRTEEQRAQPPAPQQAAPSASEEKWTGPLPWERNQQAEPDTEARGGRIFDRAPTRGETLRALTRR